MAVVSLSIEAGARPLIPSARSIDSIADWGSSSAWAALHRSIASSHAVWSAARIRSNAWSVDGSVSRWSCCITANKAGLQLESAAGCFRQASVNQDSVGSGSFCVAAAIARATAATWSVGRHARSRKAWAASDLASAEALRNANSIRRRKSRSLSAAMTFHASDRTAASSEATAEIRALFRARTSSADRHTRAMAIPATSTPATETDRLIVSQAPGWFGRGEISRWWPSFPPSSSGE